MAKQKYTFPGPYCPGCQYHQTVGDGITVRTRYCTGFPKKRRPRQFRNSDPKYKPPRWCPRLISPPLCRIYGFADQNSEMMHWMLNRKDISSCEQSALVSVNERHYRLRLEISLGMTAKQFYDATQLKSVRDIFPNIENQLEYGEVIEIDDGLKPYYFYFNGHDVVPHGHFDRSRTQPASSTKEVVEVH